VNCQPAPYQPACVFQMVLCNVLYWPQRPAAFCKPMQAGSPVRRVLPTPCGFLHSPTSSSKAPRFKCALSPPSLHFQRCLCCPPAAALLSCSVASAQHLHPIHKKQQSLQTSSRPAACNTSRLPSFSGKPWPPAHLPPPYLTWTSALAQIRPLLLEEGHADRRGRSVGPGDRPPPPVTSAKPRDSRRPCKVSRLLNL
jgi:hypothetical protein